MRHRSLTKNFEFSRCYKRGKSTVHPLVVIYAFKTNKSTRLGITTSKKIGKAVVRNRARRVLKEAANAVLPPDIGYDIVLVARQKTPSAKSTELMPVLLHGLKKLCDL